MFDYKKDRSEREIYEKFSHFMDLIAWAVVAIAIIYFGFLYIQ